MSPNQPSNLYNIVRIKNIDSEDFVYTVNKEPYLIKAGETRNFPKFMVNIGLKHLIDKILLKRDPEGKLQRRLDLRDELASQIIVEEVSYEKPEAPTDEELVQQVNRPTDLDRLLQKNKENLKKDTTIIPPPVIPELGPNYKNIDTLVDLTNKEEARILAEPDTNTEVFEQLRQEQQQSTQPMPTRANMLRYAKDTLKMEINDPKQKLDKMTAPELFKTLGLDKEENLEELGLYA